MKTMRKRAKKVMGRVGKSAKKIAKRVRKESSKITGTVTIGKYTLTKR